MLSIRTSGACCSKAEDRCPERALHNQTRCSMVRASSRGGATHAAIFGGTPNDKAHPKGGGGARCAGARDRRRGSANENEGLDRGRRRRLPMLPADGAGQATRRIRQGGRRGRAD